MKISIFSDIHGNKYALNKALFKMNEIGIDFYIFCGDAVGYYYYHNEVIDVLRTMKNIYCVLGNHDQMFIDIIEKKREVTSYSAKYGSSIEFFLNSITQVNLEFLRNLPSERDVLIDGFKIKIIHGSPWNPIEEYIYPGSDLNRYSKIDFDYVFQGHTHYPMKMIKGKCEIVNPGSIGQPRDGGYPSFAVLDTNTKVIEFLSVKYDINDLIQDIKRVGGEPSYLTSVLKRPLDEK